MGKVWRGELHDVNFQGQKLLGALYRICTSKSVSRGLCNPYCESSLHSLTLLVRYVPCSLILCTTFYPSTIRNLTSKKSSIDIRCLSHTHCINQTHAHCIILPNFNLWSVDLLTLAIFQTWPTATHMLGLYFLIVFSQNFSQKSNKSSPLYIE